MWSNISNHEVNTRNNIIRYLISSPSNYYRDEGQYEPEEIMDMLNRLGNLIQIERKMEK